MNFNTALEEIDGFKSCSSFADIKEKLDKIIQYVDYYEPPSSLSENEDFVEVQKYIQDLQLIGVQLIFTETVEDFLDGIDYTNTDLLVYLENFVYDDTEYGTVAEYISSEFGDLDEFCLHLSKTYFKHNFTELIKKL